MSVNRIGTSRASRLAAAMNPATAPIDNRSVTDLLRYAKDVSELINFYGPDNQIKGTWAQFFNKSRTFFLAEMAGEDIEKLYRDANQHLLDFHLVKKANKEKRAEILFRLIGDIQEFYHLVYHWKKRAKEVKKLGVKWDLALKIKNVWKDQFLPRVYYWRVIQTFFVEEYKWENVRTIRPIPLNENDKEKLKDGLNDYEKIFKQLRVIFKALFSQLSYLHQSAKAELEVALTKKSNHEPLMGLFLSFLKTFQFQKEHLNHFADKHLKYYYHKILQQEHLPAIPDHAYVRFELTKNLPAKLLKKGTLLLAGVTEEGVESHYETLQDVWVSAANITTLHTLNIARNPEMNFGSSYNLVSNIYYAPVANSKDGLGGIFDETDKSWPVVGEDQSELSERNKTMIPGRVGMAISAPIFYLESGERTIFLNFKLEPGSLAELFRLLEDISNNEGKSVGDVYSSLFKDAIEIQYTTTEGWVELLNFRAEPPAQWRDGVLQFKLELGKEAPPMVNLGEDAEGDRFTTDWPIIKMLLKSGTSVFAYSFFHALKLEELDIEVEVNNLTKLIISNTAGEFNNSTAFPLFGSVPDKDSQFLIGNRELFLKNIESLDIDIEWNNLPEWTEGFKTHYEAYTNEKGESLNIDNDTFKMKISALSHASFFPEEEEDQQVVSLFEMGEKQLSNITKIRNISVEKLHFIPHLEESLELLPYTNDTRLGYIKLALDEPKFAFGHAIYPRILGGVVTHNAFAKAEKTWWKRKKSELLPLPREPYNPIVKRVSLNYKAKSAMNFVGKGAAVPADEMASKYFQINPFGYMPTYQNGITSRQNLLQPFGWDGYLIIGINEIKPGLPLNLLFEFSIKGKKALETPVEMQWSYLSDNEFIVFKKEDFLYDTTFNFTTTGVISLRIPENINKNNTILPNNNYWILVSARGKIANILGQALQVNSHAVEVKWVDNGDKNHYSDKGELPEITDLVKKDASISSVTQIGPFFGGHPRETEKLLWSRISERLRHKGRAISLWDYERLVIQNFPQIRQVKCIGPDEKEDVIKAGHANVVVVSERMGHENLRPMVGFHILDSIHNYLQSVAGPHVKLKIINPNYEWLKLSIKLLLKPELKNQQGKYLARLYGDIQDFICPWLHQGDIRIGGGFKKKDLLDFIQSRPYIDYLTSFSVVHVFEKEKKKEEENKELMEIKYEFDLHDSANPKHQKDEIQPFYAHGILVPSDLHLISFLSEAEFIQPQKASISQMAIETDFVIVEEEIEEEDEIENSNSKSPKDYFRILNLE